MARYVAFLRGVNVGGKSVVRMHHVRDAFIAAGCRNVRSYIASGNLLFEVAPSRLASTVKALKKRLRRLLDGEPEMCVRRISDIERLIRSDPFKALRQHSRTKLYVSFLTDTPRVKIALPVSDPRERLEIIGATGREMFLVSRPKSNGWYGFPHAFVERFGVVSTTRTWSTVTRLARFASAKVAR